ncbi:MAG: histidine kinase [Niabella sp.]|nr:histidine kinase [Niabella sp.]
MQWHEIVFSGKKSKRVLRHLLFWVSWWIYFLCCDYLYRQPVNGNHVQSGQVVMGSFVFIKTALLMLVYSSACYIFIYFLMPQMVKDKWLKPVTGLLLLGVCLFTVTYFMYWDLFPVVNMIFGYPKPVITMTWFWPAVYLGLINPVKVIAAAAIIKYVKHWWIKNQESEKLEREKINTELQLLKAQVQPDFLFTSLNNIYIHAQNASPRASELLLKLSDILSYMLYECDSFLVPLDRELDMMREYMEMEKIRLGDCFEMGLAVHGNSEDKVIAPFLLLPFIENSIKQSNNAGEQGWINLDISIEDNCFFMKLVNGMTSEVPDVSEMVTNNLSAVQKRLTLIYPEHGLKIYGEQEILIVDLKIQLNDAIVPLITKERDPAMEEIR